MTTPAVVLKSKFVMPDSKEYNDYITYIDRKDAKLNVEIDYHSNKMNDFFVYHAYMDYMGDDEKQGALFMADKDFLTDEEIQEVKEKFGVAQGKGSPLWQDVISFDNDWLEEQGIYQSETKKLNEKKLKDVVRESINELLKAEEMENSALWTASIHHNTDNIHVHIATVEPNPSRKKVRFFDKENKEWKEQYRGKRKQGSLDKMKSKVVNQILDRSNDYNKIDEYIRGTVHYKKEKGINLSVDRKTKKLFKKAMLLMPDDLREWKYGYQSINKARPYIDEIVDIYLDMYHKKDMRELDKLLDKQVDISKRLYGDDSRHKKYKETKMKDLKKRMGNAVLAEMRACAKKERSGAYRSKKKRSINNRSNAKRQINSRFDNWRTGSELHFAVMRLKFAMRKTYHDYEKERNIDEYDRMMDGYE